VAVVGRLVERFGRVLEYRGHRFHSFPDAARVAGARVSAIRACGLSHRKAETIRRIATAIEAGHLAQQQLSSMSSEDAVRCLTELPGIGPWSASLVLLRGLGRLDVFPPGDVGAARGLSRVTGLPVGPSLARIIQRFGDHRGYLYFYALGSALATRGLIRAAQPRRTGGRSRADHQRRQAK
jgi:DNA-3-methyladenine glycosylase II